MISVFETDLVNYLKAYPTLSALIGTRLYPGVLPEGLKYDLIPAAMTYFLVSGVRHHDIDVAFPRYQFSCWSPRVEKAREAAQEVRHALQRYKGSMGGSQVIQGVFENQYETYDNAAKIYGSIVDMKIIFREV